MSQRFHIYRYQILPIAQRQLSIFDGPITLDDLKNRKNEFLMTALSNLELSYRDHELNHRVLFQQDDMFAIQVGINRGKVKVDRPDFSKEVLQNWPSFIIGFNNRPAIQKILIEYEYKAFRNTKLAIKMIQDNLNHLLERYSLHVEIKPTFEINEFWELVRKYPRIRQVEFELIAPNISNISGSLDVLKSWFPTTNSQAIDIDMKSDKNSHLDIQRGVQPIDSFATYAAQGGGTISIRVEGIRKKKTTDNTVTEIEIDNLTFEVDGSIDNNLLLRELLELPPE